MLPLYAFLIIKEATLKSRHMSQKDLLARLADYPYELEMDRKTLGRALRTMAAEELHIHCDRTGVWYDEDDYDEDELAA